jgi:uroporphyrinogen-III decarboxylase
MVAKEKSGKSAEALYQEREKRVTDAISLKIPDRVPISLRLSYFPAKYTGLTCEDAFYNPVKWKEASKKLVLDLEPDNFSSSTGTIPGQALEILGAKQIKWPGHGVSPYHSHQLLELEPLKENEYDAFLSDPSDFIIHKYLPRIWGSMTALEKIPSLKSLVSGTGLAGAVGRLNTPEVATLFETLLKAAKSAAEFQAIIGSLEDELAALGYPSHTMGGAGAPFDVISDSLRGMQGTMIDMYRRPEKLQKALDMFVEMELERAASAAPRMVKNKRVFMALHRGSDGFMSLKQFETFYWPTFKQVVIALVDMGLTPCPFFEGTWDARLEHLLELPKGKVLCHFAQTNMKKAKEVLGGHLCFMGDVPSSLLQVGTVKEVEVYCKKLLDTCAPGGGFILTHMPIDEANPANVKAMVDVTRSYGVYR